MLSWAGPVIVLLLRWGVGSAAAYTEELALQQLSDGSVLVRPRPMPTLPLPLPPALLGAALQRAWALAQPYPAG